MFYYLSLLTYIKSCPSAKKNRWGLIYKYLPPSFFVGAGAALILSAQKRIFAKYQSFYIKFDITEILRVCATQNHGLLLVLALRKKYTARDHLPE